MGCSFEESRAMRGSTRRSVRSPDPLLRNMPRLTAQHQHDAYSVTSDSSRGMADSATQTEVLSSARAREQMRMLAMRCDGRYRLPQAPFLPSTG